MFVVVFPFLFVFILFFGGPVDIFILGGSVCNCIAYHLLIKNKYFSLWSSGYFLFCLEMAEISGPKKAGRTVEEQLSI